MTITNYDLLEYRSDPIASSHPDRLYTVARVLGLNPPAAHPATARILEIGCGSGTSTIPMALSLPQAEILALDVSATQIERIERRASELGLTHLTTRQLDLCDLPADCGQFDYIISHGVYSWVPPATRDRLMEICSQHLAPGGIALISYNTYPGWHMREPLRELLQFHTRHCEGLTDRVERSREMAQWIGEALPGALGAYREAFRQTEKYVLDSQRGGSFLIHDLLAADTQPVLFREFAEHAARFGLRYLAETDLAKMQDPAVSEDVHRRIVQWSSDAVDQQQYLDFLTNRSFRKSLLCRASARSDSRVTADKLTGMFLAADLRCTHPRRPLSSSEPLEFQSFGDVKGTSAHPLTKAACLVLSERWPRPLALQELLELAAERLMAESPAARNTLAADRDETCRALTKMYLLGTLELFPRQLEFTTEVSQRPEACPLVRLQAAVGEGLTNRLQRPVVTDELQRALLPLLDGTRDHAQLLVDWIDAARRQKLPLDGSGGSGSATDWPATLAPRLEPVLQLLAGAALLVG
ncbi:MAG: methyltransferase regulatory domain-containing protein [Pirellulaceae bacterium]|nr:methyltransferase regulatory domain-containing protein [Pirellulaceae bacterium]